MKEDVEMTELALAFPLFNSDSGTSLGKRHQVKYLLTSTVKYIVWVFCLSRIIWIVNFINGVSSSKQTSNGQLSYSLPGCGPM